VPLSRKSWWGKEIKMSVPQVSLQGKPAQADQTRGGRSSWATFYSPARLDLPKESLSDKCSWQRPLSFLRIIRVRRPM
jgi:hypothetical protein